MPSCRTGATARAIAMKVLLAAFWGLLTLVLCGADEPVALPADIVAFTDLDTAKDIRLDANIHIPDGGELLLDIQVPREAVVVDGAGPAKITRVYTDHPRGTVGVGEAINVLVDFTSAVTVTGVPQLELATGCHDSKCFVREIQRLQCRATSGKFAMGFNGQKVFNIPYDASQKQLAQYLKRMSQIDNVIVSYNIADSACSYFGNYITIVFDSVNIPGVDGDLPALTADMTNTGGDGTNLAHLRYDVMLTSPATEVQKGMRVTNRMANFMAQVAPTTLMFTYVVMQGDNTSLLEYAGTDSLQLPTSRNGATITNAGTLVSVDLTLPLPGTQANWERGTGSSFSANTAIRVDVSAPTVVSVNSPKADGTYGIGEEVLIQVLFSQPVVVTGTPTLVLETGMIDRIVTFTRVSPDNDSIIEFLYTVQSKDTSPDLTYNSPTTSFQLNGGTIKRKSTTPTTDAILTLPNNGETGSLSVNKNIVVDTSTPTIKAVSAVTAAGTYTAGDTIQISVRFDSPVVVTGTPTLSLSTGSVDLYPGHFVEMAPAPGNANGIVFPNVAHGLTTASSQGLKFIIDGQELTLVGVAGDVVTMAERYAGTFVDQSHPGAPSISVFSPGHREAVYVSGSGTTTLIFNYFVQRGDVTNRLTYRSTASLSLNSGSIKRQSTNPFTDVDLTLPAPGAQGSLSNSITIVIDNTVPHILQATPLTRSGVYRVGDVVRFQLVFDLPVVVQNTASVAISTAAPERYALLESGSGSTTLVFRFDCAAQDEAPVFDFVDTMALRASYGFTFGWIRRKSAQPLIDALLVLPAAKLQPKGITITQTCSFVSDVSTTVDDGTYGTGEAINIQLTYSAAVAVDVTGGTPSLTMTTGSTAVYSSGTGTTVLTFVYTVGINDPSTQLLYRDIFALQLNGGVIKAVANGNPACIQLQDPQTSALATRSRVFVNSAPPVVTMVSTRTVDSTLTVGDRMVVAVKFNTPITVTSPPTLLLDADVDYGIKTRFLSFQDEYVFFEYVVATTHSTSKLEYFSRSSLRCLQSSGLNKDPLQSAARADAINYQRQVFVAWMETTATTSQIHVKSADLTRIPPLWLIQDGTAVTSVNYDVTKDASTPVLATLANGLYMAWQEMGGTTGLVAQVRVTSYQSTVLTSPWLFVERVAPSSSGLNKDPTCAASKPFLAVFNAKLFAAWHEAATPTAGSATQIRVAVYNGNDLNAQWSFVDGNVAQKGINYDSTKSASNVRVVSCGSSSGSSYLYAVWEESEATSGATQIRVAVMTGNVASPTWVFVDGNTAFGLNVNKNKAATMADLVCPPSNYRLVVAWTEVAASSPTATIRVKQFNGNLAAPSWAVIDGGNGLNFDPTFPATNVRLRLAADGTVVASWEEVDATLGKKQFRVAWWSTPSSSWQWMDGGKPMSLVNDDLSHDALMPLVVDVPSPIDRILAVWSEPSATSAFQLRAAILAQQGELLFQSLVAVGCILRKSTTPTTQANLLLPMVNSPGSLGFQRFIRIDSQVPVVEMILLRPHTLSNQLAQTTQVLHVFGISTLTQGEYQLVYADKPTTCIDWAASGAAVKGALEAIAGLSLKVTVSKDTTSLLDGIRYSIAFSFPTMALQSLRVIRGDGRTCARFMCQQGAAVVECESASILQLNANVDLAVQSGVLDFEVVFSTATVVTTGTPSLALRSLTSPASYLATSGILQQFDVGTRAPSPILQGDFVLSYTSGGVTYTTSCMKIAPIDSDAVQILLSELQLIPALATIGIESVQRVAMLNGFQYSVRFRTSGDLQPLTVGDASSCARFAGRTQTLDVAADSAILQGEFTLQMGDSVTSCINWNVRARGTAISLQSIVSSLKASHVIPVQVVKDNSAFTNGHRFYLDFLRLDDAREPLIVSTGTGGCVAFKCDDGAGNPTTCSNLILTTNADFVVQRAASRILPFQYVIQTTDQVDTVDVTGITGNFMRASTTPSLAAQLTVPSPHVMSMLTLVSSSSVPTVVKVSFTNKDGIYTAGDVIEIVVEFSASVVVTGFPVLELNSNGRALFFMSSSSTKLLFQYKVLPGDINTATLNYNSVYSLHSADKSASLSIVQLATRTDGTVYPISANLVLPAPASAQSLGSSGSIRIDTTTPTIVSVTSTRPDSVAGTSYGVGDIIDIVVQFSSDVNVTGTPYIHLNSGGKAYFTLSGYRQVIEVGVHATSVLTSGQYVVQYGSQATTGCIDYNDASSASASSLKNRLLALDEVKTIGIVSVTQNAVQNGFRYTVLFDSTKSLLVPQQLTPRTSDLCTPLGPRDPSDVLVNRAPSNLVTFHYLILQGEMAADLNYDDTIIQLDGGTVKRHSLFPSLDADVTLPLANGAASLGSLKTLNVDGTPITIVDVVADSAGGTYGVAYPRVPSPATVNPGEILFHLVLSRTVKVVGTPTIALATGSTLANGIVVPNRVASYVGQPQPNQMAFLYKVQENDSTPNLSFESLNAIASRSVSVYSVSSTTSALAQLTLPRLLVSAMSTIAVDINSVPTIVRLFSNHADGTFGAGEEIDIHLTLAKPVVMQTGLNHNLDMYAKSPHAVEMNAMIYVLWIESAAATFPAVNPKSWLYLKIFDSQTLEVVPSQLSPVNFIPNSFIEKARLVVWKNQLFGAWDENGIIRCARYNGVNAVVPWELIPNLGANRNFDNTGSDASMVVQNNNLVLIWRETVPKNDGSRIGQIRVAVRNDDDDAPFWIFHDGNQLNVGLNADPTKDAREPSGVVFQSNLFVSWSEYDGSRYNIVVARRYIQSRDASFWKYLSRDAKSAMPLAFASCYAPKMTVRRTGIEDTSLLISYYRETPVDQVYEVVNGVVLDGYWIESDPTIGMAYYAYTNNLASAVDIPSRSEPQMTTCGQRIFGSWLERTSDVKTVHMAQYSSSTQKWQLFSISDLNHNSKFDAVYTHLFCASSETRIALFWTEFDGYSFKLRMRHENVQDRLLNRIGEVHPGFPRLHMEVGAGLTGYAYGIDKSGLTSYTLSFLYTVQSSQSSPLLDTFDANAFEPNGAVIRDVQGNTPDFTLFPRIAGDPRSLGTNNQLAIDTSTPTVTDVTCLNAAGEYGVGENLKFQITFTAPVVVLRDPQSAPPVLYLRTDELHLIDMRQNPAKYVSGSGSNKLVFEYVTVDLDYSDNLDYFTQESLYLGGHNAIRRSSTLPTTDVNTILPMPHSAHSISGNKRISIKPTRPAILAVTSLNASATYFPGDTLCLQVQFSMPVAVFGVPMLLLNSGPDAQALYYAGNNTNLLTFVYSIDIHDKASPFELYDDRNGNTNLGYVNALVLPFLARIRRMSTTPTTDAVVSLPAPGYPGSLTRTTTIVVVSDPPVVTGMSSSKPDGTYDIGEQIPLLIQFSLKVVVLGAPQIILNLPTEHPRTALYVSGSGTTTLTFMYTVAPGDFTGTAALDHRDEQALIMYPLEFGSNAYEKPAQILLLSSQPLVEADYTLPKPGLPLRVDSVRSIVGSGRKIFVRTDGVRIVNLIADVADGTYAPGQRIVISAVFSSTVVIQGSPRLKLNVVAAAPRYATYLSGSGSATINFVYIASVGDACESLDAASVYALELNGGVVTTPDSLSVPVKLISPSLPGSLSNNTVIKISSAAPVVQRVYAPNAGGSVGVGDVIRVGVVFSRLVTISAVAPPPVLQLQMKNNVRNAVYKSGDGTSTLMFEATVANGDSSSALDYAGTTALTGTIFALATTPIVGANLQLPVPQQPGSLSASSSVLVTSDAPRLLLVKALNRNGTYGFGDNLNIMVKFSYDVFVPPAQKSCGLELLVTNTRYEFARYAGGSTTSILLFTYTVDVIDRSGRLDYQDTASLKCTILQNSASPSLGALLTLPPPGAAGSLSFNSDVQIDSTAPRITSVSSLLANGVYGSCQMIDIVVTFSEAVMVDRTDLPRLRLAIANINSPEAYAIYLTGSGTSLLTFRYMTRDGDVALPLEYRSVDALSTSRPDTIVALSSTYRRATLRVPVPRSTASLSGNKNIQIDAIEPPRIIAVGTSLADGIYTAGDVIDVSLTFSAPVVVTGTPTLALATSNDNINNGVASYTSGSGTNKLVFQYVVRVGDAKARLDYKTCPVEERTPPLRPTDKLVKCSPATAPIQLNGGSIKRSATIPTTDAILDLPEVNPWPFVRFETTQQQEIYINQLQKASGVPLSEQTLVEPVGNKFSMAHEDASIEMFSNGFPDHATSLVTAGQVLEQQHFIELKRFSTVASSAFSLRMYTKAIGILLNGILIRNAAAVLAANSSTVTDECGGAVDQFGRYFYLAFPSCFFGRSALSQSQPALSQMIGFAFDGFPIYGPYDEDGNLPQLDECGGRIGRDGQYRYHINPPGVLNVSAPTNWFMKCLRGLDASSPSIQVFRYPYDASALEGVSVPMLSRLKQLFIDETAQQQEPIWSNPEGVSVTYTETSVIVKSNGIPDGDFGPFPNLYNPYSVEEQNYVFQFPRQPVLSAKKTVMTPDTPVGIMLNGVPFYSSLSGIYGDVMNTSSAGYVLMDKCHGLVDSGGKYRYFGPPDCLLSELGDAPNSPSPIVGFAFDGFPLYGPYDQTGNMPSDLDECNGRFGDDGSYRYHVTQKAPYLVGCLRGVVPDSNGLTFKLTEVFDRSLSYDHSIRLDTQAPYVTDVFTNKHPGKYVAGETIDLVVKWSAPVQVTGSPQILLDGGFGMAQYNPTKSTASTSVFMFVARPGPAFDFNYDSVASIQLNGGSIMRKATTSIISVDLSLVRSQRVSFFGSKHQIVSDVRVVLRGLYHQFASDLTLTLFHDRHRATIVDKCCRNNKFGRPDDILRVNQRRLEVQPPNLSSGQGSDYGFQDFNGANLALTASATQSSTSGSCFAENAIDASLQGTISHQSVARTTDKDMWPWWQMRLNDLHTIGTVRIWTVSEEVHDATVQILSVDGNRQLYGNFQLRFTCGYGIFVTDFINFDAVAMTADEDPKIATLGRGKGESVQSKLQAIPALGNVFVSRSSPSPQGGYTWSITFLQTTWLADPLSVAINNILDGTGSMTFTKPMPSEERPNWLYFDGESKQMDTRFGAINSMLPYWILLFDETASMKYETFMEAYTAAIWATRISDARRMVSINPPVGTKAQYIRIQTEQNYCYLTLAEVEVFEQRNHVLSEYRGGSPVDTTYDPGTETWSPVDSFREAFAGLRGEGTWVLSIKDNVPRTSDGNHGDGAVSEWVLYLTNSAGKTSMYYMGLTSHVKTLPRHGRLFVGIDNTEHDHLDANRDSVLSSVEATAFLQRYWQSYDLLAREHQNRVVINFMDSYSKFGGIEVLSDWSIREKLLLPTGCDRECLATLQLDPYFYAGTTGNGALSLMQLTRERSIRYVPDAGFQGKDAFTFTVSIGAFESAIIGTVEIHVIDCREATCERDAPTSIL